MELSSEQRRNLGRVWRAFDERDVPYVVLRSYEGLPESTEGSDVDMLIADESFQTAVALCRESFESTESIVGNALSLGTLVAGNLSEVVKTVAESPSEAATTAKRRLVSTEVSARGYVQRTFDAGGLRLDLENHLAYTSPMDGSRIRVDPVVETHLFERRIERGDFYVPSPPDELGHLVCRGIFDYEGEFPPRYIEKCDDLVAEIRSNSTSDEQFRSLLSHLFYGADSLVYDLVVDGEYDAIRSQLYRYSDY